MKPATAAKRGKPGPLVAIGGGEDKHGEREILREVAELVRGAGPLVIATVASHDPETYLAEYRDCFADLGVKSMRELHLNDRTEASLDDKLAVLEGAAGLFFTGGDQLRITSQIGDTPIEHRLREMHAEGVLIAGTSAGATMMGETMLVGGPDTVSYRSCDLRIAPGLGLVHNVIIDQHFAERGRIGRLLAAVGQNPRVLGVGIDENTAVIFRGDRFDVRGAGAVYVIDGTHVTCSNVAEEDADATMSLHNVTLHVLAAGDCFDLVRRTPVLRNATH